MTRARDHRLPQALAATTVGVALAFDGQIAGEAAGVVILVSAKKGLELKYQSSPGAFAFEIFGAEAAGAFGDPIPI